MNDDPLLRAKALYEAFLAKYPATPEDLSAMEEDLEDFLAFVQRNEDARPRLARWFVELLESPALRAEWLLAYCMHTLRWPEIFDAADVIRRRWDPQTMSHAQEVAEAYDEDWVGYDFFPRLAERRSVSI